MTKKFAAGVNPAVIVDCSRAHGVLHNGVLGVNDIADFDS